MFGERFSIKTNKMLTNIMAEPLLTKQNVSSFNFIQVWVKSISTLYYPYE